MTVRRLILIFTVVVVAVLSFLIGEWWGGANVSEKLGHEEMRHWDQLAALDSTVLQSFPVRSNTMASGTYLMDVWFPASKLPTLEVVLHCEKAQISIDKFNRNRQPQTLSVNGSVVSWTQEGASYEANAKYVGLVDGDEMRGRVYGWNPGDQSVGLWRIYPKLKKSGQPDLAANPSQPVRPDTNQPSAAAGSGR